MPGRDHHHFPTFQKITRVFRSGPQPGATAHWIARTFFTERGLLRTALYGMLIVCIVHIVTMRVMMVQYGTGWSPAFGGRGFNGGPPLADGSVTAWMLMATSMILGGFVGELAPFVAVLCLVGLAASLRTRSPEIAPITKFTVEAADLEPIQEEQTPPERAARHPLDPHPDDPPLEPRWPKTSRPSK